MLVVAEANGLHAELSRSASRLWMRWDPELQDLLRWTAPYVEGSNEMDIRLKSEWSVMVRSCWGEWQRLVGNALNSAEEDGAEPQGVDTVACIQSLHFGYHSHLIKHLITYCSEEVSRKTNCYYLIIRPFFFYRRPLTSRRAFAGGSLSV